MKVKNPFLVVLFLLIIPFSFAFASSTETEPGEPLLQVSSDLDSRGMLNVCVFGPSHLTINDTFRSCLTKDGVEIESYFNLTKYPSKNPQVIRFFILAQNTSEGIQLTIQEIQAFKIEGWFSDSMTVRVASQSLLIENSFLDIQEMPNLYTETKIFPNAGIFKLKILEEPIN